MPAYQQDIDKAKELRKTASTTAAEGAKLTAASKSFAADVMDRVMARRAERGVSTLQEAFGTTTGQLASEPAAMRERLEGVNPLQADALSGRQLAQTLSTLDTLSRVEAGRSGTIESAIGAGTDRLLAQAETKRAEAEMAANEAEEIINNIRLQEDLAKRQFEEWATKEGLRLEQARIDQSGSGRGLNFNGLSLDQIKDLVQPVNKAVQVKASDYLKFIRDIEALETDIGGGKGIFGDVVSNKTGIWPSLAGEYAGGAGTRSSLEAFSSSVKKGLYGAALTDNELKDYKNWGPSKWRGETANATRLTTIKQQKMSALKTLLQGEGLSENQINLYLQSGELPAYLPTAEASLMGIDFGGGGEWEDLGKVSRGASGEW